MMLFDLLSRRFVIPALLIGALGAAGALLASTDRGPPAAEGVGANIGSSPIQCWHDEGA